MIGWGGEKVVGGEKISGCAKGRGRYMENCVWIGHGMW